MLVKKAVTWKRNHSLQVCEWAMPSLHSFYSYSSTLNVLSVNKLFQDKCVHDEHEENS